MSVIDTAQVLVRSNPPRPRGGWVACDRCSLTPMGSAVLEEAAASAEATGETRWRIVRCPACERVTAVHDAVDGSSFGEAHLEAVPAFISADRDVPLTVQPVRHRRRRRSRRWVSVVFAGVLTLALAAGSLAGMLAIVRVHAARPSAPRSDTGVVRAAAALTAPTSLSGTIGSAPSSVSIATIDAIGHPTWVSAAATVANLGSAPMPVTEVTFTVRDADGASLADGSTLVTLDAGQRKTVVVPRIDVGPVPSDATVEVSLARASDAVSARPEMKLGAVDLDALSARRGVIRASLVDASRAPARAVIGCVVTDRGGALAAIVGASVDVGGSSSTDVRLPAEATLAELGTATCSVS